MEEQAKYPKKVMKTHAETYLKGTSTLVVIFCVSSGLEQFRNIFSRSLNWSNPCFFEMPALFIVLIA